MAYARLEPFGPLEARYRVGILAAQQHNLNRRKGGKAAAPEDFLPKTAKDVPDPDVLRRKLQATFTDVAVAFNAGAAISRGHR
jgi:hypothetical protein